MTEFIIINFPLSNDLLFFAKNILEKLLPLFEVFWTSMCWKFYRSDFTIHVGIVLILFLLPKIRLVQQSFVAGKVINVEIFNVNTRFGHGAIRSKRKPSLYVDRFC